MYLVALHLDSSTISIGASNQKTGELLSIEQHKLSTTSLEIISFLKNKSIKEILLHSNKNTVFSNSSRFTIIPSVFFDQNQLNAISAPIFDTSDKEQILSKFIPEIDSYFIFPFSTNLKNSLKSEIGHTEISHHFASLISTYHLYYLGNSSNTAFIHYHEDKFTLALFSEKKMMMFNCFDLNSYEDVIYYTYYSFEQFGFSPANTEIHIGGFYSNASAVTTSFQKYTQTIFHLSPKDIHSVEQITSDKIISTIFDLQCG